LCILSSPTPADVEPSSPLAPSSPTPTFRQATQDDATNALRPSRGSSTGYSVTPAASGCTTSARALDAPHPLYLWHFYRVGQKVRKNFDFFTISRLYVYISQKLLKIEAYKQHMEKNLYLSPIQLSHVFGPIGHGVLQGEPKCE